MEFVNNFGKRRRTKMNSDGEIGESMSESQSNTIDQNSTITDKIETIIEKKVTSIAGVITSNSIDHFNNNFLGQQ